MLKATCVHCRPPAERARLAEVERELQRAPAQPRRLRDVAPVDPEAGETLVAVSATRCPRCDSLCWPGDVIRRTPDGLVHDFCARTRRRRRTTT